jgi:hypothetical protein
MNMYATVGADVFFHALEMASYVGYQLQVRFKPRARQVFPQPGGFEWKHSS